MQKKTPQKTLMLFNLVDRFKNITNSMDIVEKENAYDLIEAALKEINATLCTVAAEVCVISERNDDEKSKVFTSIAGDFNYDYVSKSRSCRCYVIKNLQKIKKANGEEIKSETNENGSLRTYFFERKTPILINDWAKDKITKNVAPGMPEVEIDRKYEPLIYEEYGNAVILIPINRKSILNNSENDTDNTLITDNQLLGYFHIEHKKGEKFEIERYSIPMAKALNIKNPVNDCNEWSQYDILFRFANGISRLLSKHVEWDMAKNESQMVINRFKAFSASYINQSGTIFYQKEVENVSGIVECLVNIFKEDKIDFVKHIDISNSQNYELESTRFGIFLINEWDCHSSFVVGKFIGRGKPVIALRPRYDIENKKSGFLDESNDLPTCFFEYDSLTKKIADVIAKVDLIESNSFIEFKKIVS